jgi:hypothetical protein
MTSSRHGGRGSAAHGGAGSFCAKNVNYPADHHRWPSLAENIHRRRQQSGRPIPMGAIVLGEVVSQEKAVPSVT